MKIEEGLKPRAVRALVARLKQGTRGGQGAVRSEEEERLWGDCLKSVIAVETMFGLGEITV